ncbi:MAG: DUF2500 family protein [Clostridia bacterium]|nr:DUF2500 family protein [Clostridia bacterium]MBQ4158538.1 DUF2500 family protein [Clostridia bacterium]
MLRFLIFFLLFAAAIVLMILAVREMLPKKAMRSETQVTARARVYEKRSVLGKGSRKNGQAAIARYMTFGLEDGTAADFLVTKEMYEKYEEGTFGVIIYQGNQLISFEAEKYDL